LTRRVAPHRSGDVICTVDQRQLFRKNGWPAKADIVKALNDLDPDDF
jgi:hypothetical protein